MTKYQLSSNIAIFDNGGIAVARLRGPIAFRLFADRASSLNTQNFFSSMTVDAAPEPVQRRIVQSPGVVGVNT